MMTPRMWNLMVVFAATVGMSGCGQSAGDSGTAATAAGQATTASQEAEPGHDGWWCAEHGVPEEVCTRCDPKLVAEFKAKGDWCQEHDLPDSQCFLCHPEKQAEFAALYEAKFGKQPPPIAN